MKHRLDSELRNSELNVGNDQFGKVEKMSAKLIKFPENAIIRTS